jgi:hypothetical protein
VLKRVLLNAGLSVVVSPETVALSMLATVLMCAFASATSLSALFKVEAATVLR